MLASKFVQSGLMARAVVRVPAMAMSSQVTKEGLLDEVIATAGEIKDYNYKTYFTRRATEDKAKLDDFSVEELQERLDQMQRIKTVQNIYYAEQSVVERAK